MPIPAVKFRPRTPKEDPSPSSIHVVPGRSFIGMESCFVGIQLENRKYL